MYTVENSRSLTGIGLHSGEEVTITISRGIPNSGILFYRLDKNIYIPASYENVTETNLSTKISKGNVSVSTVEHFLAACTILNITDIILSINGDELPILDGSALDFINFIKSAGKIEIREGRKKIKILKTVMVWGENDSIAKFIPSEKKSYHVESIFSFASGSVHLDEDSENLLEIISARTFGKISSLDSLRRNGLAKGASFDNVIGIDDNEKVVNEFGLRSKDEILNHKLLDVIGDISLMKYDFIGRFEAYKTGHKLNNLLIMELFSNRDNYEIIEEPLHGV